MISNDNRLRYVIFAYNPITALIALVNRSRDALLGTKSTRLLEYRIESTNNNACRLFGARNYIYTPYKRIDNLFAWHRNGAMMEQ